MVSSYRLAKNLWHPYIHWRLSDVVTVRANAQNVRDHPFLPHVPVTDSSTDYALLKAMARGEDQAAAELYDRHSAIVYGLALRIVGERADAEEVALEAFAQLWREASRYEPSRASVLGWLTTITRTRALDSVRRHQRRDRLTRFANQQHDAPVGMGQVTPPPDAVLVDADRATAVSVALETLPVAQRRAIEMAFFDGLSHPEVAAQLREPLGTVKTRIRLGMQKLRGLLAELAPGGAL